MYIKYVCIYSPKITGGPLTLRPLRREIDALHPVLAMGALHRISHRLAANITVVVIGLDHSVMSTTKY